MVDCIDHHAVTLWYWICYYTGIILTEKQEVLRNLKEALGVQEVNFLEDDSVEFIYQGYSINIMLKKAVIIREKPRIKDELHKLKKNKNITL